MRFNIYGCFVLEVVWQEGGWQAYRPGEGVRRIEPDLLIPSELTAAELPEYLDDIYHEFARPGRQITRIEESE